MRASGPAQDLGDGVGWKVVVRLGQFEHEDEVPALRVDVGVGPAELEAWLFHKREEVD